MPFKMILKAEDLFAPLKDFDQRLIPKGCIDLIHTILGTVEVNSLLPFKAIHRKFIENNNYPEWVISLHSANLLKFEKDVEETLDIIRKVHISTVSKDQDWKEVLTELSFVSTYSLYSNKKAALSHIKKLDHFYKDLEETHPIQILKPVIYSWKGHLSLLEGELNLYESMPDYLQDNQHLDHNNIHSLELALRITCVFTQASSSLARSDVTHALDYFSQTFLFTKKQHWNYLRGLTHLGVGKTMILQGKLDYALENYTKALDMFDQIDFPIGLFRVHRSLTEFYLEVGNIQRAKHHATLMMDYYSKYNMDRFFSGAFSILGVVHLHQGKYDEAMECMNRDLIICTNIGNIFAEAVLYSRIGQIYRFKKNITLAREYFLKSCDILRKRDDPHLTASSIIFAAECEVANNNIDKATNYINEAKQLLKNLESPNLRSEIDKVLGMIEREKGNADDSLYYFHEATKKLKSKRYHSLLNVELKIQCAKSFEKLGEHRQAILAYKEAIELSQYLTMDPLTETALNELESLDSKTATSIKYRPYLTEHAIAAAERFGIREEVSKRTFATILFVDIRGFTTMSEKMEVDEVGAFVNEYLELMSDSVILHNGDVNKFIGDAVMGIWFAEDQAAREHCAVDAVKSGLNMLNEIKQLNIRRKLDNLQAIHIGVGVSSGFVIAGAFGSRKRKEFSVLGDHVNTASRLEGIAKDNVIIEESTYQLVHSHFNHFESLEPTRVKGKKDPLQIWALS